MMSSLDHLRPYLAQQEDRLALEKAKWKKIVVFVKESHLNEVSALHERIGELASDPKVRKSIRCLQSRPLVFCGPFHILLPTFPCWSRGTLIGTPWCVHSEVYKW